MSDETRYKIAAVQSDVRTADETDHESALETIHENLSRNMELVDYLQMDRRYGPKLIVFSEFSLTSVPESRTYEGYETLATPIPGPVTDVVAEKAVEHDIYIAMNTWENDPDWPDRVFNTSFIVGPDGDLVLKYRKLNDVQSGLPCSTNPGDIYEEYVDFYGGPEALFPVAETELGNLACMTCYDIRFAEVARCFALRGAEVLLHLTAEPSRETNYRQSWDRAKHVRAWENQAYLVSVNNGRVRDGLRPEFRQRGESKIIGPDGGQIAKTDTPGENITIGGVNVSELRRSRERDIHENVPVTNRYRTYLPIYEQQECWPEDAFAEEPMRENSEIDAVLEAARSNAYEKGVFTPSS